MSEDQPIEQTSSDDNPNVFTDAGEDKLRAELGAIYDKSHTAVEKAQELQIVPSVQPADNTRDGHGKNLGLLARLAQRAGRATQCQQISRGGAGQCRPLRRDPERPAGDGSGDEGGGRTAQEAKAAPSIPAELQPAMQAVQQLYPGRNFHEVAADYARIDSDFKRDPLNVGFRMLQEQTGLSPLEIARQVAAAHAPAEIQQHMQLREAEVVANAYIAANPEVDQDAVVEALGKFPRSGNMAADMAKAIEMAAQKSSRPKVARASGAAWKLRWPKRTRG